MNITNDIKYIGVNDHKVDLFEGQYIVPNGMAYNSYVIMDDKIAVMTQALPTSGLITLIMLLRAESLITLWFSTWSLTIRQTS